VGTTADQKRPDQKHPDDQHVGRFRRALTRFTSSEAELEAEELQQDTARCGATPVSRCGDRDRVSVSGTLRAVTLRPRAGVPALEAELYDGSGTLSLVWLGRRQIAGIVPGRAVVVDGRITQVGGGPTMFNPRYELRPTTR
jgi:hypothetical protein